MRNLDVIKNINKFNRITSKKSRRRGSFSGIEGSRNLKSPKSGCDTPTLSAHKYRDEEILEKPKSETKKREFLTSTQLKQSSKLGGSVYNEKLHYTVSGYYYDSDAQNIPNFYSRPGPSTYQHDQSQPADSVLEQQSKFKKPSGQIIGKEDFPSAAYVK